jgi:hypothetical protein
MEESVFIDGLIKNKISFFASVRSDPSRPRRNSNQRSLEWIEHSVLRCRRRGVDIRCVDKNPCPFCVVRIMAQPSIQRFIQFRNQTCTIRFTHRRRREQILRLQLHDDSTNLFIHLRKIFRFVLRQSFIDRVWIGRKIDRGFMIFVML